MDKKIIEEDIGPEKYEYYDTFFNCSFDELKSKLDNIVKSNPDYTDFRISFEHDMCFDDCNIYFYIYGKRLETDQEAEEERKWIRSIMKFYRGT